MNKIDQILPGTTPPAAPGKKSGKAKGDDFNNVLEKAVAGSEIADQTRAIAASPQVERSQIPIPPGEAQAAVQYRAVETAERFLDLLDNYSRVLGDEAGQNLKQVGSALDALKASVGEVDDLLSALDRNDPLFAILSEARAKVEFEDARFQRGDYLSGS